ncbi:SEC14 cytosolic factor [Selaginella moellendorffii]|nr:SEC14 cytosolic factor [Selaginella moellendorffii]|eukprot:XP_002964175.2 SEC14 cytosolic factor [Selaginella moellendorffii]
MFDDSAVSGPEAASLGEFRICVERKGLHCPPGRDNDELLLRFLRARMLDVPKAAAMYEEFVRWHKEQSVDSVLEDFSYPELERVIEAWPQAWHKTDKRGRPVNIQLFSRLNVEALFEVTSEERLIRRGLWVLEDLHQNKLPACSRDAGHHVGRVTIVIDLKNVGISTFTNSRVRKILSHFAHVFSQYYPEYLGQVIIVNAPVSFKIVWQLLGPFMDEKTRKKISIHRGDGSESLLEAIDSEDLPAVLGGSCHCKVCKSFSR